MRSLALALLLGTSACTSSPAAISPPPLGEYVVDQTGALSASDLQALNALATEVNDSGVGQLAIVFVRTTGAVPSRAFALHLFNDWGVGHAELDNGAMLFVALDDRKAEIILGSGVDDGDCSSVSDRVMQERVVANFKRGSPEVAAREGAVGLAELLRGHSAHAFGEVVASGVDAEDRLKQAGLTLVTPRPHGWVVAPEGTFEPAEVRAMNLVSDGLYSEGKGRIFWVGYPRDADFIAPGLVAAAARRAFTLDADRDALILVRSAGNGLPGELHLRLPGLVRERWWAEHLRGIAQQRLEDEGTPAALTWLGEETASLLREPSRGRPITARIQALWEEWTEAALGVLAGAGGVMALAFARLWRRRPRRCLKCGTRRKLLDEQADDAHLTKGGRMEESLGSADYDVWHCEGCQDTLSLRYGRWFSGRRECGKCGYATAKEKTTTLVAATTHSEGSVRVDVSCAHCGLATSFTRSTPRIQESSSDSSSSSSSSFGGGSSSGGGSSGSW